MRQTKLHLQFILILLILAIAGCRPSPLPTAGTSPATLSPQQKYTDAPSSSIPTLTNTPAPTDTQVSTDELANSVPCFVTYYDPFAFLPDSLSLLVRADMGAQIFNLQTMKRERFIQALSIIDGPAVALSPDGTTLAWAFSNGEIQEISLTGDEPTYTIHSEQETPLKLEFSPSKDTLYSSSHDGNVWFWDLQGGQKDMYGNYGELSNIGVSPDGSMLALVPADGPVTLVNADNFVLVKELGGTGGYDTSDAVFSPDGKYLAADLATGLFVWKVSDGTELVGADQPIYSMAVAYSPDGKFMAYAESNNLVISSPDGQQVIRTLEGHQAPIFEVLFSPDNSLLVSADDVDIRVWRVADGRLLAIGKRACP